jgi:hypothetical protein
MSSAFERRDRSTTLDELQIPALLARPADDDVRDQTIHTKAIRILLIVSRGLAPAEAISGSIFDFFNTIGPKRGQSASSDCMSAAVIQSLKVGFSYSIRTFFV